MSLTVPGAGLWVSRGRHCSVRMVPSLPPQSKPAFASLLVPYTECPLWFQRKGVRVYGGGKILLQS